MQLGDEMAMFRCVLTGFGLCRLSVTAIALVYPHLWYAERRV